MNEKSQLDAGFFVWSVWVDLNHRPPTSKAGQHFACVADYCGLGGIYGEGVGGHGAELKKPAVGGLVWG